LGAWKSPIDGCASGNTLLAQRITATGNSYFWRTANDPRGILHESRNAASCPRPVPRGEGPQKWGAKARCGSFCPSSRGGGQFYRAKGAVDPDAFPPSGPLSVVGSLHLNQICPGSPAPFGESREAAGKESARSLWNPKGRLAPPWVRAPPLTRDFQTRSRYCRTGPRHAHTRSERSDLGLMLAPNLSGLTRFLSGNCLCASTQGNLQFLRVGAPVPSTRMTTISAGDLVAGVGMGRFGLEDLQGMRGPTLGLLCRFTSNLSATRALKGVSIQQFQVSFPSTTIREPCHLIRVWIGTVLLSRGCKCILAAKNWRLR